MFVQVIQGSVGNADGLRAAVDRWQAQIAPLAGGWLGTTGGVTADGTAIAVVRFESPEAAQANGERPEQQRWWEETSGYFDGEVTFHDCTDVFTFLGGGSDAAGFVQIIQSRTENMDGMRRMMTEGAEAMRQARPDVLGGVVAVHGDDGGFTQVVYFTSEAEARRAESADGPPPEMDEDAAKEMAAVMGHARYFDLTSPWLYSAT